MTPLTPNPINSVTYRPLFTEPINSAGGVVPASSMRFVVPTETPAPSRLAWCVEASPSLRPEYVSSRYDSSLPSPTSTVRRVASPSPSNGREPSAAGSRPSSTMVTVGAATRVPRRSSRNEARRYRLGPLAAPAIERSRLAAMSGSKITGTSVVFTLRAPSRRSARAAAVRPIDSGSSRVRRRRAYEYQASRCISPSFAATGDTVRPKADVL